MKILLLCWRDSTHPQGGGSERYLERVGEYLAGRGHEVVYRTAGHTDAPRRSHRNGVRFSRSGGKFTVYPRAWVGILLGRVGIGTLGDIDVVVDTQNGIPFFARLVAGRPTVLLTHHRHKEQWPVAGRALAVLGWFLESQVAPRVYRGAQYVTVSESSRADLIELGVREEDITIIRNGLDPVPESIPLLDGNGATHLVTLSRLVPHKQIEHAMDTLAQLPGNVVLDVIGSGWWEDELRQYAQTRGVVDRVCFHGQVTEDYKHALLARATVHLMPSRKEGWGLAVMEAAQHGVPTIGYRTAGGLRNSVLDRETGLLADSPAELTELTARLLADAEFTHRLGEAARKRAEGFSWAQTGGRFEELLTAIAQATPRRG
ncbi:glycosyltransferase family 4 protein [Corynebacterium comes]|uniref:GDP-mannose-dependent alpha-(1-6)-phosphatidylinositol monomannoside mannosyltransferase n=1 Tax=Corynebacterium comes TaxID=2675218 RepID=A0A6B8VZP9_9CORY|nr:glycosyltransferase family 4 protein [Corynebacterium comes]QGU05691.1 GDP-mannose-dependent alpha-(1-6)-phosphatidylinositol monomannoside mannosyltransferase [Corynebacterium comes]